MKKIYTIIILAAVICIIYGFIPSKESGVNTYFDLNVNAVMIPDVMNKVNVLESNGDVSYRTLSETDSFPLFAGFPVHVSGTCMEGGIYCNMDSDTDLEIVYNATYNIYAVNLNGTNVPGWPKTVSSGAIALDGAPSFGDIDGDGQGEIVATSHGLTSGGYIYAFEKNGSAVTGFPINHGYTSRTPVLADLDNNNSLEIIVNKRLYPVGEVWVYSGNGTVYPGWPKAIGHVPASSAAVGDITGDGQPEIIAESYNALYAWNKNGDSLAGFPFFMPNSDVNSYSSPVLADVDGDNMREIIFGTHVLSGGGYVYIVKNNGTVLSGWPKSTSYWIYSPPAVGFIDGDNILDIAVGDQIVSFTPVDYIYAWNKNGTALSGFPAGPLNAINVQISLADIDNDNMTELIVDDNTTSQGLGKYLAYNHDGSPASGWPINTTGTTFFNTPCLLDINNNGILDIVGASTEGSGSSAYLNIYLWNTGVNFNAARTFNPIWQYNSRHNGVYGDNNLVGVSGQISSVPEQFKLYLNYPNPFNPSTKIKFDVPSKVKGEKSNVKLIIYDVLGKEIETLVNGQYAPGSYEVVWDASGYSTGVYFYRLNTEEYSETVKMVLVK
jgi:hypothetical protein